MGWKSSQAHFFFSQAALYLAMSVHLGSGCCVGLPLLWFLNTVPLKIDDKAATYHLNNGQCSHATHMPQKGTSQNYRALRQCLFFSLIKCVKMMRAKPLQTSDLSFTTKNLLIHSVDLE